MGRPAITVGRATPRLTPKQREMLLVTIAAGHASNFAPSRFRSAWAVRIGNRGRPSVVLTFADSVGRRLLELGYLAPHPDPARAEVRGPTGLIGRRFVPTAEAFVRARGYSIGVRK